MELFSKILMAMFFRHLQRGAIQNLRFDHCGFSVARASLWLSKNRTAPYLCCRGVAQVHSNK